MSKLNIFGKVVIQATLAKQRIVLETLLPAGTALQQPLGFTPEALVICYEQLITKLKADAVAAASVPTPTASFTADDDKSRVAAVLHSKEVTGGKAKTEESSVTTVTNHLSQSTV